MSHEGDERRATPGLMTYAAASGPAAGGEGSPVVATAGEMLAERYRLEEHIDTDAAGRQIWRGIDMVLRRPVALVIREPGGDSASAMLTVAVAMSRLVHPHIVSVYDAIDETDRAYLVREWVSGMALRDILRNAPLDAERSTLVTHAVAEAVSALHTAGITHGNVHPGTILVADDGRVVLADTHADAPADPAADVRCVGAVLYACLTGLWPYAEAGHSTLPDAVRDGAGQLATPRQVRGGIPRHLDEIVADLLDLHAEPPSAAVLAAEFARLATAGDEDEAYSDEAFDDGPMGFSTAGEGRRRAGGKLALGVAVLTAIAILGAVVGAKILGGSPGPGPSTPSATGSTGSTEQPSAQPIPIGADQIRVVDPPKGDRTELEDAAKAVDGDEETGWTTDGYTRPDFGGLKPGMGLLIDLGEPTAVGAVRVVVNAQGASIELRTGDSDPGNSSDGDAAIADDYTTVGTPLADHGGTVMVFSVPEEQQQMRYLLVWITKLPAGEDDRFRISVNEITVLTP